MDGFQRSKLKDPIPEDVIYGQWAYLLQDDVCPVWISEFGTGPKEGYDLEWFRRFIEILGRFEAGVMVLVLGAGAIQKIQCSAF